MNFFSKIIASVLLLGASVASLSAQFDQLRYRAEGGVTASRVSGVGHPSKPFLLGFRLSGQVVLPFRYSNFALQTGLTLTNKGENSNFYVEDTSIGYSGGRFTLSEESSLGFMYLSLPLEVSYRLNINALNKIYLAVGPSFNYALSGAINGLKAPGISKSYDVFGQKLFKRFEVSLGASAMYAYRDFYIKVGAEYGLTTIDDQHRVLILNDRYRVSPFANDRSRHALVYATLGYQF
ncbi:outer membrane beta-barrel protein [Porphyromonas sp. COT-290 OH860]|uniref:outer membrane beta-barrel protein n=1 Tax=Porphyromonas sp. COT-290 OH860 TaxID=1515615 RepID=UPI0006950C6D|nr:outer membrane beta-barrel protein [Porphyromonas sp. COT-290 OH860]